MKTAIATHEVSKLYGKGPELVGLRSLSLEVGTGQVLAVLGHNGAGKTTLINGLTTLLRFDSGSAHVAGFDVASHPQAVRERISLVGQGVAVDDQLTATQNLVLFGRLRGLNRHDATERATVLVADFGLVGSEHRPVAGFSGGMRRRLDLAAAMIVRPEVLFVDEPTTGLDPTGRHDLWRALEQLVDEGTTVLLTTQYLEEADALASHIVLLAHGAAIAEGSSDDLKGMLGSARLRMRFATAEQAGAAVPILGALAPAAVEADSGAALTFSATDDNSLLTALTALANHGIAPTEASLTKPSLDEVFMSLTSNTVSAPDSEDLP